MIVKRCDVRGPKKGSEQSARHAHVASCRPSWRRRPSALQAPRKGGRVSAVNSRQRDDGAHKSRISPRLECAAQSSRFTASWYGRRVVVRRSSDRLRGHDRVGRRGGSPGRGSGCCTRGLGAAASRVVNLVMYAYIRRLCQSGEGLIFQFNVHGICTGRWAVLWRSVGRLPRCTGRTARRRVHIAAGANVDPARHKKTIRRPARAAPGTWSDGLWCVSRGMSH